MKKLLSIFRILFKILYWWYWRIPIDFSILAFGSYFGLMYLCYGTLTDIKGMLRENDLSPFWCFFVPFGIPVFLSFGATIGGGSVSTGSTEQSTLDSALEYRNGQMNVSPPKKASRILQKTAILDIIKSEKEHSKTFENAHQGFNARYGASSPTKIYDDLMKND